jgi:hypothetical protein
MSSPREKYNKYLHLRLVVGFDILYLSRANTSNCFTNIAQAGASA